LGAAEVSSLEPHPVANVAATAALTISVATDLIPWLILGRLARTASRDAFKART
jgi:hypothetical protein